jgi:hypothetical protein
MTARKVLQGAKQLHNRDNAEGNISCISRALRGCRELFPLMLILKTDLNVKYLINFLRKIQNLKIRSSFAYEKN